MRVVVRTVAIVAPVPAQHFWIHGLGLAYSRPQRGRTAVGTIGRRRIRIRPRVRRWSISWRRVRAGIVGRRGVCAGLRIWIPGTGLARVRIYVPPRAPVVEPRMIRRASIMRSDVGAVLAVVAAHVDLSEGRRREGKQEAGKAELGEESRHDTSPIDLQAATQGGGGTGQAAWLALFVLVRDPGASHKPQEPFLGGDWGCRAYELAQIFKRCVAFTATHKKSMR